MGTREAIAMKEIIIVCNNAFGMAVRDIVNAVNQTALQRGQEEFYRIKGYLCPLHCDMVRRTDGLPILGDLECWQPRDNERCVMGIVDPVEKKRAVLILKERGCRFETLVAPWTMAPSDMRYGEGAVVAAYSMQLGASVAPFSTLYYSMVTHTQVGAYSSIMAFANTTNAIIEPEVLIEANAAVMLDKVIGEGATVKANSIVVRSVKPHTIVAGNPARRVKQETIL